MRPSYAELLPGNEPYDSPALSLIKDVPAEIAISGLEKAQADNRPPAPRYNVEHVSTPARKYFDKPFIDYKVARLEEPEVFEATYNDKTDRPQLRSMLKMFSEDPVIKNRIDRVFLLPNRRDMSEAPLSDDLSRDFLGMAGRYRLLEEDEEISLTINMKRGVAAYKLMESRGDFDNPTLLALAREGAYSYNALFHANLRLVIKYAYHPQAHYGHMPAMDILKNAYRGLHTAIEKFDETKGFRFSTYAVNWIRNARDGGVDDEARMIRLPRNVAQSVRKIEKTRNKLATMLNREPTSEEVQAAAKVSDYEMDVAETYKGHNTPSLNMIVDDGDTELGEMLPDKDSVEEYIHDASCGEDIRRLMASP